MFGTSYVCFGSDPTYTQKIMKIPDIAWPTFFDSYREFMLRTSKQTIIQFLFICLDTCHRLRKMFNLVC